MTSADGSSPAAKVLLADAAQTKVPGRWALLAVGGLLLSLFIAGVALERSIGNKSTTTPAAATSSGTTSTPATSGNTPASTSGSQKKTEAAASETTTKSLPPEGVMLALLGTGAALVLVSALYTRISAIKLPGGAEIDLSPAEKEKVSKEVAQQVAAKAPEATPADELAQATTAAYDVALDAARMFKLRAGGKLDETAVQRSVQIGVQHADV